MSNRYLITGVQLGMLIALPKQQDRQKLVDEIQDKQWVGVSDKSIIADVKRVVKEFFRF